METPSQHILRSGVSVREALDDKAHLHLPRWFGQALVGAAGAVVAGSEPTTFPSKKDTQVLLFLSCPALIPWFQRWQRSMLPLALMVAPQQSPFFHRGSSRATAGAPLALHPPGTG